MKPTTRLHCLIACIFLTLQMPAQTLLDQNTFDEGLEGWESNNGWDWSSDGTSDFPDSYWGDRDAIRSASGPGSIRYKANPQSDIGQIISRPFTFVDQDQLFLRFTQYCRKFTATSTFTRVRIHLNGAPVQTFDLNQNLGTNIETDNNDVQIIDLSAIAPVEGEYSIQVEFEFIGQYYFWLIDDVQFYDSYPYPETRPAFFGESLASFGAPYDDYGVDTAAWAYVPQQLVVQFAAGVTEAEKQLFRDTVGAIRVDTCACNRIELWELTDNALNYGDTLHPFGGTIGILSNKKGTGSTSKIDGVDLNYYNGTQLANLPDVPLMGLTPAEISNIPLSPQDAIKIAILDTGVDITHESIFPFIYRSPDSLDDNLDNDGNCIINDPIGWNFVDSLNNVFDDNGHGTHVAGIIAETLRQLSYDVDGCTYQILPYKTHDEHGISTLFDVTCATYQAVEDGAAIINDSWGFYGDPSIILQNALDTAQVNGLYVVTAAGNEGIELDTLLQYPACYDNLNIISVAADSSDVNGNTGIADFSNFSQSLVDIAAPGVDIRSALPKPGPTAPQMHILGTKSGTSMAAPAVSAALAKSYCFGPVEADLRVLECATQLPQYTDEIVDGRSLNLNIFCLTDDEDLGPGIRQEGFTVYPNPSRERVYLRSQIDHGATHLQILSMDGRVLQERSQIGWNQDQVVELDIQALPAGMYILRVQEGARQWSSRLIKL